MRGEVVTVIAAYIDPAGNTAIGCDTGHAGSVLSEVPTKIARVGNALVGVSGASLWFRYCREAEPITGAPGDVERFADGWLAWAKARGHGAMEGREHLVSGEFIVLLGQCVYRVGPDGSVHEHDRYVAGGSGCDVAMGALHVAAAFRAPAHIAVEHAVSAALAHGPGCFGRAVVMRGGA